MSARGAGQGWVRLPDADIPVLLAQFAKTLLGEAAAELPLQALRPQLQALEVQRAAT